jgi:hypothetical protein
VADGANDTSAYQNNVQSNGGKAIKIDNKQHDERDGKKKKGLK